LTADPDPVAACDVRNSLLQQVIKELPGKQDLYEYNKDEKQGSKKDANGQHINPAVYDGTMHVVQFGWDVWRERLQRFLAVYDRPISHSGFTDDEDSDDNSSHTLGRTPPSPPQSDGGMPTNRRKLLAIQEKLRRRLNRQAQRVNPGAPELGVSEAMLQWGNEYPILRVRAYSERASKVRAAIRKYEDDEAMDADISSTMENGISRVMERHNEWASYVDGTASSPPRPSSQFMDVDTQYRKAHNLPIIRFN
jgi:hypothetical protein